MSIEGFLLRMPKVELHVHLEGSMRPATLLALAKKNGITLPATDDAGIRRWLRFRDFDHFLEIYATCSRCLCSGEDFQLLGLDFLAEQAMQNVSYSEVHVTISSFLERGLSGGEILDALVAASEEGERRYGVRMALIPDIVRGQSEAAAERTLEWAIAGRERGVVALGISGRESEPSTPFVPHFQEAARNGLQRVAHAGEHAGADSMRRAIDELEPARIGHGVRAVEDPALVADLAARRIPFEVCPSSNVALGVVPTLAEHPVAELRRRGVVVTVNSDDPPLFHTNLTREYVELHRTFGWTAEVLARCALDGLEHSFLDDETKRMLREDFEGQMHELGKRYLRAPVEPA